MNRYKAVVFDWDGTVMDSTRAIVASIQGACADLGLPVPDARQASWVIGLSLESALYHAVPTLTADLFDDFQNRYRAHYLGQDGQLPLFDGMAELLASLRGRGVLLGVATGKSRLGLDRVLTQRSMHGQFDVTRCADESFSKPHPAMLLEIMDALCLEPDEVLMVGDTSHDMQMARNAGIDGLAVTYGAHDPEALNAGEPLAMVDSVAQMRDWLSGRIAS
ncbi:HAD-IA family hydrolase [Pusillimonas sp.]|uniref:HAD-IA family hydrolase n=1 Tax=Pusillimonas sp. TaxID=3040095 RepID=UPI0029A343EA|nr:HAD-IA family hydrolase [Pusillimonas sp.]MDX3893576.1 HAD-IA family hydrolase [Pusillimonas sp.]